jgi:hypothetical protein
MRTGYCTVRLVLLACLLCTPARATDWLRLRDGRVIPCAILSQDTLAVFTTDWNSRHLLQPPLQVFSRDEVESVWFTSPPRVPGGRYMPHTAGWEAGGAFAFQGWAETELVRRYLLLFSLHGGYTIMPQLSLELDADFTFPFGGRTDSLWRSYGTGYQTVMNVVAHPFVFRGVVPYALLGGGAALAIPVGNTIVTRSHDIRSLVDFGLGIKWGSAGLGYCLEWRHHFYEWTPDATDERGVRVPAQSADASVIRATLFIYR